MATNLRRSQRNRAPVDYREHGEFLEAKPLPSPRKRKPKKSVTQKTQPFRDVTSVVTEIPEPDDVQEHLSPMISQSSGETSDLNISIKLEQLDYAATVPYVIDDKKHQDVQDVQTTEEAEMPRDTERSDNTSAPVREVGIQIHDALRAYATDDIVIETQYPEELEGFTSLNISHEPSTPEKSNKIIHLLSQVESPAARAWNKTTVAYRRPTGCMAGVTELVVFLTIIFFVLHISRSETGHGISRQTVAEPMPGFCEPDRLGEALLANS